MHRSKPMALGLVLFGTATVGFSQELILPGQAMEVTATRVIYQHPSYQVEDYSYLPAAPFQSIIHDVSPGSQPGTLSPEPEPIAAQPTIQEPITYPTIASPSPKQSATSSQEAKASEPADGRNAMQPGQPMWDAILDLVRQTAISDARADAAREVMEAKESAHVTQYRVLEQQVAGLRATLENQEAAEKLGKEQHAALRTDLDRARQELSHGHKQLAELAKSIASGQSEQQLNFNRHKKDTEQRVNELSRSVERGEAELKSARNELVTLERDLDKEREVSKSLRAQLERLKDDQKKAASKPSPAPDRRKKSDNKDRKDRDDRKVQNDRK